MFNFLCKGQDTQYVFIFLFSTIKQMLVEQNSLAQRADSNIMESYYSWLNKAIFSVLVIKPHKPFLNLSHLGQVQSTFPYSLLLG